MKIILNSIKTPDGTILKSSHVHDFVTHLDKNGKRYGVDGGRDDLHRIGDTQDCEDLSISIDQTNIKDEIVRIREHITWGTRGKDGDQPLEFKPLKDLDTEHLNNLRNNYEGLSRIDPFLIDCFKAELEYRKSKNMAE